MANQRLLRHVFLTIVFALYSSRCFSTPLHHSLLRQSSFYGRKGNVKLQDACVSKRISAGLLPHQRSTVDTSLCFSASSSIGRTLLRGAFLRVISDLTGGTVFENIKTRSALSSSSSPSKHKGNPLSIAQSIVRQDGWRGLWRGTPSRMVEGSLVGAVFLATSTVVKLQLQQRVHPATASLLAGLVGGVAQAVVMTPTGLIFTAVNSSPDTSSFEVVSRILREEGVQGLYAAGGKALVLRQATNWASRAGMTEMARQVVGGYGVLGELGAGVIGGLGSCWNTPIETIRVLSQSDAGKGKPVKPMGAYWKDIVERDGYQGLFRGVSPRALQAVWQTTFMIVVPNLL